MIKFTKKSIIIALVVVIILAGGYAYFSKDGDTGYDFVIAKKGDLIQEVSVTGYVKPVKNVDLAFEVSGKIIRVSAGVGDTVEAGQVLVVLDDAELTARLAQAQAGVQSAESQLNQYQSSLEIQQAKLSELERGTRIEEIQISKTKVSGAQKALADDKVNLENVKQKADVDLQNLYDQVTDVLNDAYAKADDAINKQTDELFSDDNLESPQLTFTVADVQLEIDAEKGRLNARDILMGFKSVVDTLSSVHSEIDQVLTDTARQLTELRSFMNIMNNALNSALGLAQSTVTGYRLNVNTSLANLNIALSNTDGQIRLIKAQKSTNQSNISTAQSIVNSSQNNLILAQDELRLKEAGSSSEEITAQRAQVKQAEANVSSQFAKIKQEKANVLNIKAKFAKTALHSPIDGIVTTQDAKVGEIAPVNTPLVSVMAAVLSSDGTEFVLSWEIEANIPEADIAKINIGDTAKLTLDAYDADSVFKAKVTAIDPAETVIDGVATYKTTLQFEKGDRSVKSGMTANIDILSDKREGVIAIPQRAVISKDGNKIVRVLTDDGDLREIKVTVGLRGSDGNIEIIKGINVGEKVIVFIK